MAESTKSPTPPPTKPIKATGQTAGDKGVEKPAKPANTKKPAAGATPTKAKGGSDVKIVEKSSGPKPHKAQAKPTLTPEIKAGLFQRKAVASRRPKKFRRQQWYEYKRLADSGWRKPRGVDSAMRRHFGYEQPVVRVGFRGPEVSRGLHPTGFREVYVTQIKDLAKIDPKTQAARINGHLGMRTLRLVYAEADKLGVRILNRRQLQ